MRPGDYMRPAVIQGNTEVRKQPNKSMRYAIIILHGKISVVTSGVNVFYNCSSLSRSFGKHL